MKAFIVGFTVIAALMVSTVARAQGSAVSPDVISLPDGPGSISGLGEEFTADANSGAAGFGIGIEVPGGSGGLSPELKILYSGGSGNSSLGFGWSMGLPRIQRQTDKGLPRYGGEDSFIYRDASTAEELVPLADESFRLKNEGAFIRAIRAGDAWEVRTKSGLILRLGESASSRVMDAGETKIFAWNVTSIEDRNGNRIAFEWSKDGGQSYLSRVRYNDYGPGALCEIAMSYEPRSDALADYRAGFPVVTARRLTGIRVRRGGKDVRSYSLSYDSGSILSRLAGVVLAGSDGATEMPPLSFAYTAFDPGARDAVEMEGAPGQGLADPDNALVDLNADSLPDLLVSSAGDYTYYLNADGVSWHGSASMSGGPSYELSQPGVRLADIDGDGSSDLVIARTDGNKYLPGDGLAGWGGSVEFDLDPVGFDLSDADTRFADIDGDRMVDVIRTGAAGVSAWIHRGGGVYERMISLPKVDDSEDASFSNASVHLADMNGDGLVDVVKLRSESLIYWPSMGYGLFDDPVAIAGAPHADDESRLRIADANGDGLADVIHLGVSHVSYWLNMGDGTLGGGASIGGIPAADPITTSVRLADMNGNGTTDILWVDVSSGPEGAWQYLDLIGDERAGLLAGIDNGMGKVVRIRYESSTAQMVRQAASGDPWEKTLPFPISVVREVAVDDGLGTETVKEYSYSDGYYDGVEREFRGFAESAVTERGDSSIAGLRTVTAFDVGDTDEALKGKPLAVELGSEDGTLIRSILKQWSAEVLEGGTDGRHVTFAGLATEVTSIFEGGPSPKYIRKDYAYDEFGNVIHEYDHGEVSSASDDGSLPMGDDEVFVAREFAIDEPEWLVGAPSRESVYDSAGRKVGETVYYYDGAVFVGLPFGQIDRGRLARKDLWLEGEGRYVSAERYRRDEWGNVTAMLDAEGGRREIAYDSTSHTHPVAERIFTGDGALEFRVDYDDTFGKVESFTDPGGAKTEFRYDALGRLSKIIKPYDTPELPTVQYDYILSSPMSVVVTRQREISGRSGTLDSYRYMDGLGRVRAEAVEDVDGSAAVTKAVLYNSRGRESFAARPFRCAGAESCILYGQALMSREGTEHAYDALGRLVEVLHPDGTSTRIERGPLTEIAFDENDLDPASAHRDTPTLRTYDGLGRMAAVSFRDGVQDVTTSFTYDARGNVVAITDPAGNVRVQEYDSLGRMTAVVDPNAGRREFAYDDVGRLVERGKPDGLSVKYMYQPGTGRILARNLVTSPGDDSWEAIYHYDSVGWDGHGDYIAGKLSWVEDEAGREYFGYDARGRLIAKRRTIGDASYDLSYAYDSADRKVSIVYPDGASVDMSYDERGLIKSVGDYLVDRSYTPSGQLESEVLGAGIVRAYSYDSRGRLASLAAVDSVGKLIQSFAYRYDSASNITDIVDGRQDDGARDQSQSFVYDDLYRLTGAQLTDGGISWSYDIVGNITGRSSTLPDGRFDEPRMLYGEDAGPYAMTQAGDKRYEYDANGNLVRMPGQSLEYDALDRLARVAKADGSIVEMIYDHADVRRIKRVSGSDGSVAETIYADPHYEVRDDKAYRYIWAGARRIARVESGAAEGAGE